MANDVLVSSTTDRLEDVATAANTVVDQNLETGRTERQQVEPEVKPEESSGIRQSRGEHRGRASFQRRIDRITQEKHELRQENERLRAQLAQAPQPESSSREPNPHRPTEVKNHEPAFGGEPERETPAQEEARRSRLAETRERESRDAQEPTARAHEALMRQAHDRHYSAIAATLPEGSPDRKALDEAAHRNESITGGIRADVLPIIHRTPNSVDVAAHLITHPQDVHFLNSARTPEEAAHAVRLISAYLAGAAAHKAAQPRRTPVSKAPAPVRPVTSAAGARTAVDLSDPNLSYQDYKREREEQKKNRYR